MTPPLNNRHGNRPLPSPASSPNLSIRSAMSAPPIIRIENSAPNLPTDQGSQSDVSAMQQKVLQLPPVNTWVPKGESLFNSILDQRSPQVYRRTNVIVNKPASFSQSNQGSIQSSRVSWPQRSQSCQPQLSPPVSRHAIDTSLSEQKDLDKSPKLLRKCTSFDMERSKPFPARSMMSSPMLLKKGASVDESEAGEQFQSPKMSKWSPSNALESESDKIVHREEDELFTYSTSDMSYSESFISSNARESSLYTDLYGSDDVLEFDVTMINESLEDPNIPETAILNDIVNECNEMAEVERAAKMKRDNVEKQAKSEPFSFGSSPELGAKPKTKKTPRDPANVTKKLVKSKTNQVKLKTKDSPKTSPKIKRETSSTKSDKGSDSSDKSKSKTSTSTVKTALLSSAAKLKAMSRRSPVTLLSYKSHSISVPDHSSRAERPFSTSDIDTETKHKRTGIHQTESSPTVLTPGQNIEAEPKVGMEKPSVASPATKRDKTKTSVVQSKIDMLARKNKRPCETASASDKNLPRSTEEKKNVKSKSVVKTSGEKTSKVTSSLKSAPVDKHSKTSLSKSTVKSLPEPTEPHGSKKKIEVRSNTAKKDAKDMKPKSRLVSKRDSVSSVNSDSSKKSDHFHDCCHVRRKPADKK